MNRSRRKFLKLLAAGSAAVAARPAAALAAGERAAKPGRKTPAAAHEAPPALRAEIERQQKELAKTLKTIRDFPLEPGSNPAFAFAPLRAARAGKKP